MKDAEDNGYDDVFIGDTNNFGRFPDDHPEHLDILLTDDIVQAVNIDAHSGPICTFFGGPNTDKKYLPPIDDILKTKHPEKGVSLVGGNMLDFIFFNKKQLKSVWSKHIMCHMESSVQSNPTNLRNYDAFATDHAFCLAKLRVL